MLLLLRFYKNLIKIKEKRPVCVFKISKVKYSQRDIKKIANFNISVDKEHSFFDDFPVLFRFHSNTRFKGKIKINYRAVVNSKREEIINKTIRLETQAKEYIHYIDDIIVGRIYFEVELETEYGKPIIEFIILENKICRLNKEYKLEIIFP